MVPGSTARTLSPLPCPRGSQAQGHGSRPGADGWGPASGRWFDQGGQGRRAHEGKPSGHVRAHSVLGRKPKRQDMYPDGSGRRVRALTLFACPAKVWGWARRPAGLSLETGMCGGDEGGGGHLQDLGQLRQAEARITGSKS